jgi:hypothetical protein
MPAKKVTTDIFPIFWNRFLKKTGEDLDDIENSEQLERYRSTFPNLIPTDSITDETLKGWLSKELSRLILSQNRKMTTLHQFVKGTTYEK